MAYLASLALCLSIVFAGAILIVVPAAGLPQTDSSLLAKALPLASGAAIFAGIISSIVFDRFDNRFQPRKSVFRASDLIVASILSPIVFLAFYPLLQQTADAIIAVLLAYQNGFVFQNVIARVRGRGTTKQ